MLKHCKVSIPVTISSHQKFDSNSSNELLSPTSLMSLHCSSNTQKIWCTFKKNLIQRLVRRTELLQTHPLVSAPPGATSQFFPFSPSVCTIYMLLGPSSTIIKGTSETTRKEVVPGSVVPVQAKSSCVGGSAAKLGFSIDFRAGLAVP